MSKKLKHRLRNTIFVLLGLFFAGIGFVLILLATIKIPDLHSFDSRKVLTSTKIYDRTGENLLYDLHEDVKRTVIPPETMGANIKNATVAIEDSEFYLHKGVRLKSILRALYVNVFQGKLQGGSTITQQLIKNSLLTQERTVTRKLKEWILSIKIEQTFSKDEILGLYLNDSPYGGTIYGIQEAAETYFKKNPEDLTIAEAAYLASIPQAPTTYSPYGKNKDRLDNRKNIVLSRMLELGFITDEEYKKSKDEVVVFEPQATFGIRAPHFVFYVRDYLLQKYGWDMVYSGGLKVITTLDLDLQTKAEEIVKKYALENEKTFKASNAGLVAMDPKTGQVLVMVGSRDYFDKDIDGQYNIATADRQPGSSFKPFAYATAFEKGYLPETAIFDVSTEFSTSCATNRSTCYRPENFDNKFRGPISMRSALAESRNIASVKVLYLAGIANTIKTARDMGIRTLVDENRYGLTLVLGGGEVQLLDMASAYGVFANGGVRSTPSTILSLIDKNGNSLESYQKEQTQVLPKNVALQISDVLSDNPSRSPTFGLNSPLYFPGRQVAAKTGTTNDNRDGWLLGYTPSIVVGVWSGNNDNSPMLKSSSTISGPLWHAFMAEALQTVPVEEFESPDEIQNYSSLKPVLRGNWQGNEHFYVDTISGGLATDLTPEETRKEFVITNVHSILYWVDKNNPLGDPLDNPKNDPQYELWERGVQDWWNNHRFEHPLITESQKPSFEDTVHIDSRQPDINIISPNENEAYQKDSPLTISINDDGYYPIKKIDILINGSYSGTATTPPFSYTFIPSEVALVGSTNEITLVVYDSVFNKKTFTKNFSIE